ncbi:MAG: GTP pyrophosphokinase [Bacillota bacterium]|uniref:GTP pyrophosphokinase family protein n=1 Tax=Virgibacillus salarius TaxID=447199 RepID=A0A941IDK9_9BACI|nr:MULTISPECIES: GTP pyrophosphokinase family protein [Bacillaceae]NAZ09944.1 GTP pyrophosphokinase family protein [Agaribacter marinus]MBR7797235.1 GTP pyrophosphokinase family protein [Virgibacillus salarius]MCC2250151.1 GTP pyrophosphokinase family protein [Virgibacillus sp. AGTR]MDY7045711.1 GTP pyrophosphokinase family protein [Virgibacillus sp. M23]QRZ19034.1 GTP pyrophosphokinase family protein [Virgibacillus sp. AGTR]
MANSINQIQQLKQIRDQMTRFMMTYKFGLDEINTKLQILQEEFQHFHDYNPIEHIKSRIKSPESILKKMYRKNLDISLESIRENIHDIVGIRIVCSFISDIYRVSEMIQQQKDITVISCKDYIKHPKSTGYQSLHLILSIPVFMSDREEHVYVEIQIRTVAMDFWASLEHKIYYKYNKVIPDHLSKELTDAAKVASDLDLRMEQLHNEVNHIKAQEGEDNDLQLLKIANESFALPRKLLESFIKETK